MSDPRRRERHGAPLNQDYYMSPPPPAFDPRYDYGSQSPPRSRKYEEPPPRRHKSERRRPLTPELDDPYDKPSRRKSRRDPRPQVVNPPPPPPGGRRPPPAAYAPPYAPEPPEPERIRHRNRDMDGDPREHKPRRRDRNSMPPPSRDGYDPYMMAGGAGAGAAAAYPHDPRDDRRPPKGYRGEPEHRPRRQSRHSSPPPDPRMRGGDPYDAPRSRRRDAPPPHHRDDRYRSPSPPRRHRSQGRPAAYDDSPPHSRGRPPPATAGRPRGSGGGKAPPRRSSMPAITKAKAAQWWQNPLIQAGARNAFSAGAQAAIRSKNDSGPWIGPKGAKVATAALSAALVDGIMGKNHGTSAEVLRTGADAAMDDIDKGKYHIPRRGGR